MKNEPPFRAHQSIIVTIVQIVSTEVFFSSTPRCRKRPKGANDDYQRKVADYSKPGAILMIEKTIERVFKQCYKQHWMSFTSIYIIARFF